METVIKLLKIAKIKEFYHMKMTHFGTISVKFKLKTSHYEVSLRPGRPQKSGPGTENGILKFTKIRFLHFPPPN